MVETLCSTKDTINVAGDDYPAQLVKEKLLRINCLHIDYVLNALIRPPPISVTSGGIYWLPYLNASIHHR